MLNIRQGTNQESRVGHCDQAWTAQSSTDSISYSLCVSNSERFNVVPASVALPCKLRGQSLGCWLLATVGMS